MKERTLYLTISVIPFAYIFILYFISIGVGYRPPLPSYSLFPLIPAALLLFKRGQDPVVRRVRSLSAVVLLSVAIIDTVLLMIGGTEAEEVLHGPLMASLLPPTAFYGAICCNSEHPIPREGKWRIVLSYLSLLIPYPVFMGPVWEKIPLILSEPLYSLIFMISHMTFIPIAYYIGLIGLRSHVIGSEPLRGVN